MIPAPAEAKENIRNVVVRRYEDVSTPFELHRFAFWDSSSPFGPLQ
jgi:hypothetical protein